MDATSDSVGTIINSEFGDKSVTKGLISSCDWWDDLIVRVAILCDNALELGKKQGYANCHKIHKDKIMTAEAKPVYDDCSYVQMCKFYKVKEEE